jgi:hypothetical protein
MRQPACPEVRGLRERSFSAGGAVEHRLRGRAALPGTVELVAELRQEIAELKELTLARNEEGGAMGS